MRGVYNLIKFNTVGKIIKGEYPEWYIVIVDKRKECNDNKVVTGGIYILIVLNQQKYGLTAALMLIFYGLALINASKYSIGNIRYLGFIQTILGLICALFPDYGFWIWILGFGVMHIIYGVWMHIKFDTNY